MSEQETVEEIEVTAHMADGSTLDVQVGNPDLCRWDTVRLQRGWPTQDQVPFLFLTFVTWATLHRTGRYEGKFEPFRDDDCLRIAEQRKVDVNPTPPGAEDELRSSSLARPA